jgi:hypothetical protein
MSFTEGRIKERVGKAWRERGEGEGERWEGKGGEGKLREGRGLDGGESGEESGEWREWRVRTHHQDFLHQRSIIVVVWNQTKQLFQNVILVW